MPGQHVFPRLVCSVKLDVEESLYDVKFWPWPLENNEQIFAIAGTTQIFICRTKPNTTPPFEILRWLDYSEDYEKDEDKVSINSIAWIPDGASGKPILCAAGGKRPKHILLIDIETGETLRSLHGHGRNVNELMSCPALPNILGSCSEDFTVRLWSTHPNRSEQPCLAIFAGEGHRQPLLASSIHPNGKWLLTGAMDTAVGLWAIPKSLPSVALENSNAEPKQVFYPHFFSNEVHHNYVDCVVFYGDLIISRCAKSQNDKSKNNDILLWKIDGFESDRDPPSVEGAIAEPGKSTRSAFPHESTSQGFQRLMTFSMTDTDRFYLRFGLYHVPDQPPILCMGNQQRRFCFWNLQKLETAKHETRKQSVPQQRKGVATVVKKTAPSIDRLSTIAASESSFSHATAGAVRTPSPSLPDINDGRSVLQEPMRAIEPHYSISAKTEVLKEAWGTYATAWSPDGHWCVCVGDFGSMAMFYRERVVWEESLSTE